MINALNKRVIDSFWKRVRMKDGCWDWLGSVTVKGRPRFKVDGETASAYRISYLIHKGTIPPGLLICHTCDNPSCCNPDHLWVGTHADNQRDCFLKKRRARGKNNGRHTKPETTPRGVTHGRSTLTDDDVRHIRRLGGTMPQAKIGELFNTPQTNVSLILRGLAWKHVTS